MWFSVPSLSGVEPWSFEQHLGQAVFVPAGCPFQMKNLKVSLYMIGAYLPFRLGWFFFLTDSQM
uniref:JmjC domain-containing protein n=1 Tax=Rhizophora mucronata TaxID=61149 RepID=A0A2P2L8R4_RHIMU